MKIQISIIQISPNHLEAMSYKLREAEISGAATTATTTFYTHRHNTRRRWLGIGKRAWLVVSETGEIRLEEVERHSIMRRTGIHARDLRILDPMLSYTSSIFARDRAVVVNLEHVKVIITAKEVLMIDNSASNSLVTRFVQELKYRLFGSSDGKLRQALQNGADALDARLKSSAFNASLGDSLGPAALNLPFEFRALEACLVSACRCLESETHSLEKDAYPALDGLTFHVSKLKLERVRQIKSRLVALCGRVQKVRDELEQLLDDDNDIRELYLTEKLDDQYAKSTPFEENSSSYESDLGGERAEGSRHRRYLSFGGSKPPNVEGMVTLLEAYFVQSDAILRKLSLLREYANDTENYVNVMLDGKRNRLLQTAVMFRTAVLIVNTGVLVTGVFGMKIRTSMFESEPTRFWETTFGIIVGCIGLYLLACNWCKRHSVLS